MQGSLFGIAGRMREQYTQALMVGAACAGLVTSMLRALTKVHKPRAERERVWTRWTNKRASFYTPQQTLQSVKGILL